MLLLSNVLIWSLQSTLVLKSSDTLTDVSQLDQTLRQERCTVMHGYCCSVTEIWVRSHFGGGQRFQMSRLFAFPAVREYEHSEQLVTRDASSHDAPVLPFRSLPPSITTTNLGVLLESWLHLGPSRLAVIGSAADSNTASSVFCSLPTYRLWTAWRAEKKLKQAVTRKKKK